MMTNWVDITTSDDQARGFQVQIDTESLSNYRHRIISPFKCGGSQWLPGKPPKEIITKLLELYLKDQLPENINLVYVPFKRTAYGDIQLIDEYHQQKTEADTQNMAKEEITIEQYFISGKEIWAGFGPETQTLVVGKKLETSKLNHLT